MSQSSPPSSLGDYLRQEREKKGITIEQVASATKISIRMLHALEANQYSELPAKPFIRGFVASYARFVGLDSRQILTDYGDFLAAKAEDRPNRDGGHSGYAFERKDIEQSRTLLWGVMAIFIVIAGVGFALRPLRHKKNTHMEQLKAAAVASPIPSTLPEASPSPSILASPSPSPRPLPRPSPSPRPSPTEEEQDKLQSGTTLKNTQIKHKIIIKALTDVWVRYQCDDRKPMVFMLLKDRILVLRGEKWVKFQFSNPSAISINYNSRGYRTPEKDPQLVLNRQTPTLIYPPALAAEVGDPFPNQNALPQTPSPINRSELPTSGSSPSP